MVILLGRTRMIGHEPKKKLGFSQDYGHALFGYCEFGADNEWAGIYRKYTNDKKNYQIRMRHYIPSYRSTPALVAVRTKFAEGITAWRALSPSDKLRYETWGAKYRMSGYNKFLSEYLKDNVL